MIRVTWESPSWDYYQTSNGAIYNFNITLHEDFVFKGDFQHLYESAFLLLRPLVVMKVRGILG